MKDNEYSIACTEVLEVLKYIPEKDYNKIPENVIDTLKKNKKESLVFLYNPWKSLNEQQMSEKGRIMIASFFRDYWATETQREKIIKKQNYDRQKLEVEKQEKYDVNIFNNKSDNSKQVKKNESNTNEVTKNSAMIVYKENIFKKFIDKIIRIFSRKK